MTFWIPKKKEIWQREKPAGLIELNQAHSIGAEIDILIPLDGSLEVYGRKRVSKSELLSSGSDTTYLQWTDRGIKNTYYDGVASDGMGLKTALPAVWNHVDRTVGFQILALPGDFSQFNFGLGDRWNADTGFDGARNDMTVKGSGTDIGVNTGARLVTFTGAFIRDGQPHTYVAHTDTEGGIRTTTLFIDGKKFDSATHVVASYVNTALINLGCGSNHHNRGLNGEVNVAFYIGHKVPVEMARELSEAPYQVVNDTKSYFMLGAAGGAGAALAGDAANEATANGDLSTSGAAAVLEGDATGQATAAAEATTGIPIAGAMLSVATSSGVISTGIDLGAAASAISLLDGNIDTEIRVSVAAIIEALAQAGLDAQTLFEAAAAGQADASGTLQSDAAALEGDATGVAQGSADLSTSGALLIGVANAIADGNATITIAITMQGDALAQALAQAGLTVGGSGLEGDASAVADALAAMLSQINMIGGGSAVVTSLGGIDTILQMQGAAASASNMLGGLNTSITVEAAAFINALAQAGLTTAGGGLEGDAGAVADANGWLKIKVQFDGDAVGEAVAAGNLTTGAIDIPTIPRWTATAGKRNWTVEDKRSWEVCA